MANRFTYVGLNDNEGVTAHPLALNRHPASMKPANYAILDERNRTLWVRPYPCPAEVLSQALNAAQTVSRRPRFLVRSHVAEDGSEVLLEFLTDTASTLASHPQTHTASIDVLLADPPRFDIDFRPEAQAEPLTADKFVVAARFTLVDAAEPEQMLEHVFELSQNIDMHWHPTKPCRSSSTGDVFLLRRGNESVAYEIRNEGYRRVELG